MTTERKTEITGGINIAMKVPSHQYAATLAFYRDVVGLPPFDEKVPAKGFLLGPNRLWIDEAPAFSQAEVWGEGFQGGWIMNPANIVHMLRRPDAW